MKQIKKITLRFTAGFVFATGGTLAYAQAPAPKDTLTTFPAEAEEGSEALHVLPPATKLKKTLCVDFEENDAKSLIQVSFNSSRKNFHVSSKQANYLELKSILKDACDNDKPLNVRFDPESQRIEGLTFVRK